MVRKDNYNLENCLKGFKIFYEYLVKIIIHKMTFYKHII